jgi:predicted dinucleotide-binding enzyme
MASDGKEAMRIAVIGAGNIGRTLGGKWAAAGHHVTYGVRHPGEPGTAAIADAVAGAEGVGQAARTRGTRRRRAPRARIQHHRL